MNTVDRLLFEHPRSLGEGYLEHQRAATGYGLALIGAGLACLLHAIIPALCRDTASRTIHRLHDNLQRRFAGG